MENYFELFCLEEKFNIDKEQLENNYQAQIIKFHPDKFTICSEKDKINSQQNTSLLNSAFSVLSSNLKRATYLLELKGIDAFAETDTKMDSNFLIKQIELRDVLELIETNKDELKLSAFIIKIKLEITELTTKIAQLFFKNNLLSVKNLVRELKFNQQLHNQAKILIDSWL